MLSAKGAMFVKKYSVCNNLCYILKPVAKAKPSYLVCIGISALLTAALPLASSWISAQVVGLVGSGWSPATICLTIVAMFACYGLVGGVQSHLRNCLWSIFIAIRLRFHMHRQFSTMLRLSLEQYESEEVRQQNAKAMDSVGSNSDGLEGMVRRASAFLGSFLGLVLYSLVVGSLNLGILALLVALSTITVLVSGCANRVWDRITDPLAAEYRVMEHIDRRITDVPGGKDVRVFGLSDWLIGKYEQSIRKMRKLRLSYDTARFLGELTEVVLAALRTLVCYLFLIRQMEAGMPISQFVFYLGLISGFAAWITQLGEEISELRRTSRQTNDLRAFLDIETDMPDRGEVPSQGFRPMELVFDHVSYRYPGAKEPAIDDLSFTLHPGEHLALVGLNGAGKSTLVKLMSGLYLPSSGHVYVNGVDTRSMNRVELMRHVAAIFQDPFLLSYTIGENVALSEEYDEAQVWQALEEAGLAEKIRSLPGGLKCYLGKDIDENGVSLSGGESQRLLLARALYRRPSLLLLDEPTAALDALAENEIYAGYDRALAGISTLFISHRLASTQFCDRILLLENGRLAEEGSHRALMALGGSYARLFGVQSKYYQEDAT